MNPILPSEIPYVIGFIALVVLAFFLIGRAADSGALERRIHPAWMIGCVICWAILAAMHVVDHQRVAAAFYLLGAIVFAFDVWRQWQRG